MSKINEANDLTERVALMTELVAVRKSKGLNQKDIAEAMGVGQPSISEFERGSVNPRLNTLQRYARALGMKLKIELVEDE